MPLSNGVCPEWLRLLLLLGLALCLPPQLLLESYSDSYYYYYDGPHTISLFNSNPGNNCEE